VRETREHPQSEIGDVLFAAVNVARKAGVHPSNALRHATDKFVRRFRALKGWLRSGAWSWAAPISRRWTGCGTR